MDYGLLKFVRFIERADVRGGTQLSEAQFLVPDWKLWIFCAICTFRLLLT
jgi:hypothetical protein